ncbi:MAG TPA: hypothetical protein PKL72_08660 [Candidatus Marinimicrobia bacterium]|nr:hypothetical protein [Candidatus Neomarinimicrobiota bacterium]
MKKLLRLICIILVGLLSQVSATERFAILYTGSVMGETEPCG